MGRNQDSLSFQFQDFREYGYDGAKRLQKIKEHRFDLATLIRTGALRPVDTPILTSAQAGPPALRGLGRARKPVVPNGWFIPIRSCLLLPPIAGSIGSCNRFRPAGFERITEGTTVMRPIVMTLLLGAATLPAETIHLGADGDSHRRKVADRLAAA